MATLSVVFPSVPGASFDLEYAERVHLPLVMARWRDAGLERVTLLRGIRGSDGGHPPFLAIAILRFQSTEELHRALAGEHAKEIGADISRFTDIRPLMQVNVEIGG